MLSQFPRGSDVLLSGSNPTNPIPVPTNGPIVFLETARKIKLVKLICRIIIGLVIFTEIASIPNVVTIGYIDVTSQMISIASLPGYLFCYWLAKQGRYTFASQLLVGLTTFAVLGAYVTLGTVISLVILMIPIVLACVLLQARGVLITSGVCLLTALAITVLQDLLHIYQPDAASLDQAQVRASAGLISIIGIVPGLIALIYLPAQSQAKTLQDHNEQLETALQQLNNRYETNHRISQTVVELAQQLREAAWGQTNDSNEQVSLVAQLNSSATELSAVAAQIASTAQHFSTTIETVVGESEQIGASATQATRQGQQGLLAVQHSVNTAEEVSQLYVSLVEILNDLSERSSNMQTILTLVNTLAQQTHLLSLNAAIEAVGAGVHGERFGVIAQEVKNLATRSRQANTEVISIVSHIQTGTAQAVQVAQAGYTKALAMTQSVIETGQVIEGMGQVVSQTENQAQSSSDRLHEAKSQIENINIATDQQRSASFQIVRALQGLKQVAEQSARNSELVSSSASNLEDTSLGLRNN